jgi:hypothetical protein
VAADYAVLTRLRDARRVALAWASIVKDAKERTLKIDQNEPVAPNPSKRATFALPA